MPKPELLILDDELKAVPNPYYAGVESVARISEKGRDKAVKVFAWVFHVCDPTSAYATYVDDYERRKAVSDVIWNDDTYQPDEDVQSLMEWYETTMKSPLVHLMEGAQIGILKLTSYYKTVDFGDLTDRGSMIHDPKKVADTIKTLGSVVEGLKKLTEEVEKEQAGSSNRAGIETNEFSE